MVRVGMNLGESGEKVGGVDASLVGVEGGVGEGGAQGASHSVMERGLVAHRVRPTAIFGPTSKISSTRW